MLKAVKITGLLILFISTISGSSYVIASADGNAKVLNKSSDVKSGMLVSLDSVSPTPNVVPASIQNCSHLAGIAIDPLAAGTASSAKTQVADSGVAQVFVSNINGPIAKGDSIGCSELLGVGSKVSDGTVIGQALGPLTANSSSTESITLGNGTKKQVVVGSISVLIDIKDVFAQNGQTSSFSRLQQLAHSITGREIATWRIVIALMTLVVVLILSSITLFVGVRYALIATGRNPMAAAQTRAALRSVIISGIAISVIGFLIAYAIMAF